MSSNETRPNPHEAAAGPDRSRRDSRSRHHPGARIGRLTVIERAGYSGKSLRWRCHCDCGRIAVVSPNAQSCGCLQSERTSASARRHGHARGDNGGPTPLYRTWRSMRDRCENPRHKSYAEYGGRGIRVCERWQSFESFAADMGVRPPGTTLDRVDVNGNYEPGNCRWSTSREQNLNRRNNRLVSALGATRAIAEWARISGLSQALIRWRLENGWDADSAVTLRPDSRPRDARRAS